MFVVEINILISLVITVEITNIRLQICDFMQQIPKCHV